MNNNSRHNNNNNNNNHQRFHFYYYYYYTTLAKPQYDAPFLLLLLASEIVLCGWIVRHIEYTEIDWKAYMQQVQTWWQHNELDYTNIRGDTGPLVYPAGFLYLFGILKYWTTTTTTTTTTTNTVGGGDDKDDDNDNIRRAQYIFAAFYVATQAVVLSIFHKTVRIMRRRMMMQQRQEQEQQESDNRINNSNNKDKDNNNNTIIDLAVAHHIWSWRIAMGCLCLSKRLHSIFLLRLFNDGPTMLFCYTSIFLFLQQQQQYYYHDYYWNIGCVVFSLAVSLKMNVLLFAPGLFLLLLQVSPNWQSVVQRLLVYCALPQLLLGAPFLMTHPVSYLRKAFELDRVFFYKWTVNWKFLPENIFLSKSFSLLLLGLHLGGLAALAVQWLDSAKQQTGRRIFWNPTTGRARQHAQQQQHEFLFQPSPEYIAYTLLVSNFIGIAFARTLHYQFYSWYFHAVPYLLWFHDSTRTDNDNKENVAVRTLPVSRLLVRIGILLGIETAFLTYPATAWSSALLQVCHLAVLWQIRPPKEIVERGMVDSKKKTS